MSNDRSVTMIVPAADRDAANTYAVAMNWGPIFSVALSPTGALPVIRSLVKLRKASTNLPGVEVFEDTKATFR